METPAPQPAVAPTGKQKLLGWFVAGQLVFIVMANVIPAFRLNQPLPPGADRTSVSAHVHDAVQVVDGLMYRWAHVTGQFQGWSLYSGVAHHATYLAVDVEGDGFKVRMPSPNEPEDIASFVRPVLTSRLGGYEFYLLPGLWEERLAAEPEKAQQHLTQTVRDRWLVLHAYLNWQLQRFRHDHPTKEPRQVTLIARRYYLPAPGEPLGVWRGPVERPLFRWQLDDSTPPKVDIIDPQTGLLKPLTWKESRP